jgi:hypothetical protein
MSEKLERAFLPFEVSELGWIISEGEAENYRFQQRLRRVPEDFPRSSYPIRLNIFWAMERPLANGLASPEDIHFMHKFEDRIVRVTELDGTAVLTVVLTGRGQREFVFYARSSDDFLRHLSQMPQEKSRYPIEIHRGEDQDWTYFDNEAGMRSSAQ